MEKSELLSLAREYAKNEDLFELLGIDALKAEDPAEVRRAWRKSSLKYHPDKVGGPSGDGFNDAMKAKWELLERAREILSDPTTRDAYNSARSAILIREQQRAAMDAQKRAMIDDLEARERLGTEAYNAMKRKRDDGKVAETEEEKRAAMERARKRREERQQLMREAEERERLRNNDNNNNNNASIIPDHQQNQKTPAAAMAGSATQPQQQQQQPPQTEPHGDAEPDDDPNDPRVADLKRRLEAVRQRKAAKKARKENKGASSTGTAEEPEKTAATLDTAAPAPAEPPKAAPKRSAKMDALLARLKTARS
ncbi:pre-mRNA-splicing factor cwc23 [Apiospora arundinis]